MIADQNEMKFEPSWQKMTEDGADSCNIQWRVSQVSCWTDWEYDPRIYIIERDKKPDSQDGPNPYPIITVYEPCDTSSCCARQFKVCRIDEFKVVMTPLDVISDGTNCDTVTYNNMDCYFTCDYLDSISYQYKIIEPEISKPEKKDINEFIDNADINVIYTKSKIIIKVSSEENGILLFNLYNLIGGKILINEFMINKGNNIFDIDISDLQSGIYLYYLSVDKLIKQTGKINLIR